MSVLRHVLAALLVLGGLSLPQGSARAETYHTCAGFIDSVPAAITSQGTWCLRRNLSTSNTSGAAIRIDTNNVTIDCNNFKIGGLGAGAATLTKGIRANSRLNVTIRNCNIRGFRYGIDLDGDSGGNHLVENNRLDNNTFTGIAVDGDGSVVRGNIVADTGGTSQTYDMRGWGIITTGSVDVIDNTIAGVMADQDSGNASVSGITAFENRAGVIQRNRIRGLVPGPGAGAGQWGISMANGGTPEVSDNVIVGNNANASAIAVRCSYTSTPALAYNNRIIGFGAGTDVSSYCVDAGNISDAP